MTSTPTRTFNVRFAIGLFLAAMVAACGMRQVFAAEGNDATANEQSASQCEGGVGFCGTFASGTGAGGGAFGGGVVFGPGGNPMVPPQPSSEVATAWKQLLNVPKEVDLQTTLAELPDQLTQQLGQPSLGIYLDRKTLDRCGVDLSTSIRIGPSRMPIRTLLHRALSPHGLRSVVTDDGLCITVDFSHPSHSDRQRSLWIVTDAEALIDANQKLDRSLTRRYVEMPLGEAIRDLGKELGCSISIDTIALEEIGLTEQAPVCIDAKNMPARSLIANILDSLDLVLHHRHGTLQVTTSEASEESLIHRIHFVDGLVGANHDLQSITDLILTTCSPDAWESLGGPSMIRQWRGTRPRLVVSTTLGIHHEVELLLDALRQTTP